MIQELYEQISDLSDEIETFREANAQLADKIKMLDLQRQNAELKLDKTLSAYRDVKKSAGFWGRLTARQSIQLEKLHDENQELQQDLDVVTKAACENLFLEKTKKAGIIKELREALEFYANEADLFEGYFDSDDYSPVDIGDNFSVEVLGRRAREVLGKIRG